MANTDNEASSVYNVNMDSRPLYNNRMHSIFRNQPSYTYFNKSFGDLQNNVYQFLNEIDPHFVQPQELANKRGFQINSITDPRTQKELTKIYYDHTKGITTKVFCAPKVSSLNAAQHNIGVRIVKARQEGNELTEDDFLIWHKMESHRLKESQEFQKFVYDFSQTNKEQIYTPAKRLMELYKQWYERKTSRLLKKYPSESYNTHLGLPHLRLCKEVIKEQWAEIVEVTVISDDSLSCNNKQLDLKQLNRSLNTFSEDYMNSEDIKDQLENEAKKKFLNIVDNENSEDISQYIIPLDSLMFILTAGEYIDLPTEMLMDIKENEDESDQKYIVMDIPLPARQMGWHTCKQTAEQAAVAFLSMSRDYEEYGKNHLEISACHKEPPVFKVAALEEYVKSYSQKPPNKYCKFSQSLTKWQLKAKDKDSPKQIYTLINTPPCTLKLEHKPSFGCELMTKYELLHEWFRMKLQKQTISTCYRLDVNNFQTLLEESQNLTKLELQLSKTYHINLPQLLSNFYEFLSLLTSMPSGHYMLRYNPNFKDKLMLCKPSQEIAQNTIHLHDLLKTEPCELLFMSQQSYLPIADDLCSLMHMEHKILPCTFKSSKKQQNLPANPKKVQKPFVPINDKDWILARCNAAKKKIAEEERRKLALYNSRKKKAQRSRKKLQKQRQCGQNEEEELQREIELDEKILGN